MSEIRPIGANKNSHKRQAVNCSAEGDVAAKKNSTHHSKTRNNIPKNLRYDLENALVGLCDVWFEEIKPYLIRNNIKVHGDAGGDIKRSASPDCSHVDPGRFDHRQQYHAGYVNSSSTQQTASKAPSRKQEQRSPQVLAETQIVTQTQNQQHICKKEIVIKPRKRRKCQPQTQPRQLIPRLCRTTSCQQNAEVQPAHSVDPVIKSPVRYKPKLPKQNNNIKIVDASTQTEESMNRMKICLKTKGDINSELLKLPQRPTTTTISRPKKNKHYTETPLFKDDLLDIIAEKEDKILKVLYTSPRREECPSVMNLFSPSTSLRKSTKFTCNRIPPWK